MDDKTQSPQPVAQEAPQQPVKDDANQSNSTGPKNIAWDKVLQDYCTSNSEGKYPSLTELAVKYGVAESTIKERSSRENWVAKRTEIGLQADQRIAEDRAKEIKETNNAHLSKWRRIQNLTNRHLNTYEEELNAFEAAQKRIKEIDAIPTDSTAFNPNLELEKVTLKKLEKPSINYLNQVVTVLKIAIEGERIVLGLPIVISKADVDSTSDVELTPEVVAEIDRLMGVNRNVKQSDQPVNQ